MKTIVQGCDELEELHQPPPTPLKNTHYSPPSHPLGAMLVKPIYTTYISHAAHLSPVRKSTVALRYASLYMEVSVKESLKIYVARQTSKCTCTLAAVRDRFDGLSMSSSLGLESGQKMVSNVVAVV